MKFNNLVNDVINKEELALVYGCLLYTSDAADEL